MEHNFSQDYAPHIVGSVFSVTGNLLGRSLIDGLRKRFSPRCQEQRGDYFKDQSRELLQKHLNIIPSDQQLTISDNYAQFVYKIHTTQSIDSLRRDRMRTKKQNLEKHKAGILGFQKLRTATEYKRLSKETYWIIRVNLYPCETIPALSYFHRHCRKRLATPSTMILCLKLRRLRVSLRLHLEIPLAQVSFLIFGHGRFAVLTSCSIHL